MSSVKQAFEKKGHRPEFALGQLPNTKKLPGNKTAPKSKNKGLIQVLKSILGKWPWLYQSIVLRRYFKAQENLFRKITEGKKYDLIVEYHILGSTMGVELAKMWGAEFSVIFDSPSPEQFNRIYKTRSAHWNRINRAEKLTMEAASRILCYSPACQEYLNRNYSLEADIQILPSRLHKKVEAARRETETFNIGFIGSFLEWHKLDLLVRVFKEFQKERKDARLMLIGFGKEWFRIKDLVQQLNLDQVVEIPGFVSEEELVEYKSRFTIGVMPGSNWYGSPLKLFEYAELGIPFVAPVSKTVSSVFKNQEHCLFVKIENEEKTLLEALELYYNNPELRDRLGQAAKQYIETEFSKEVYQQKLVRYLS